MANVITSLRLCSTLDWSQYFEAVSLVERVLQRDPAGVYGGMDFLSRDRYRQAVEELAEPTGEAQVRVGAARGGERAPGRGERRRSATAPPTSAITSSARAAATWRPTSPTARGSASGCAASCFAHATGAYLGSIALAHRSRSPGPRRRLRARHGRVRLGRGWRPRCCCSCPPASWPSPSCSALAARLAPPRRLPRLELHGGRPRRTRARW